MFMALVGVLCLLLLAAYGIAAVELLLRKAFP